jgi:malic enzyme
MLANVGQITDGLFYEAARALASELSSDELDNGLLYPPISRLRQVSLNVATKLIPKAAELGLCEAVSPEQSATRVAEGTWIAVYQTYNLHDPGQ